MKTITACFLFFALISCFNVSGQATTARQLFDEYHSNEYTFQQKYINHEITVSGKIRSLKKGIPGLNEANAIFITATGFENFIVCQFPLDDTLPLMKLKAEDVVTIKGNCTLIARDAMLLKNCTFSAPATNSKSNVKKVPVDIPLGAYHVYQANGTTFNFQYKLQLPSYSSYIANNEKGLCSYDRTTKVIHFTSGKFKGFTGIYRPINPDNEKDPPTIVIDPTGKVPNLQSQYGKTYMLAYLQ